MCAIARNASLGCRLNSVRRAGGQVDAIKSVIIFLKTGRPVPVRPVAQFQQLAFAGLVSGSS
mgnify:CR=1 FL=1